jgi:predicted cupin superfamily sugar epimerase
VWHYYAGAPLTLELAYPSSSGGAESSGVEVKYDKKKMVLGPHIFENQELQVVAERHVWQRAKSAGAWTLVGCSVAPRFVECGFEMAVPGWGPN